jgi:hypothetical protein
MEARHRQVDATSSPVDNPEISVVPNAIDPNNSALCDRDLSPGTPGDPCSRFAFPNLTSTAEFYSIPVSCDTRK